MNKGRDWGTYGEWAFLREAEVRAVLGGADPDIARALAKSPQAIRSSYSPSGKTLKWSKPDWRTVLVLTEYGIGDPVEHRHVRAAFDATVDRLNDLERRHGTGMVWHWDSINPGVQAFYLTEITTNPSSKGARASGAVTKYRQFHQHDPKRVGNFAASMTIPATTTCVGPALEVLYRSDKLNPTTGVDEGWIEYIHKHSRGVNVYRCDAGAVGETSKVPAFARNATELAWLGDCIGFSFTCPVNGKRVDVIGETPLPELYTIPSGKALLVIQSKRTILAMIWGGNLGVEPRGIVH